jgi:hypothetical protein
MTRIARFTTAAALLGGIAAAGMAAAQAGPPDGPPAGPMMGHRGGLDCPAIDTDGNGSLSRAELVARASERLARADANGDGTLDRAEIVAAMPGPHGGLVNLFAPDPGEAFADRLLAMMGATETGQVTIADMAGKRVNFLFAFADTDRDAAISQAEADAMREERRGGRGERHGRHHGKGRPGGWEAPGPDAPEPPQDRG